ncbi:MAG: hypothetical protein H6713_30515 [Myxococcales bacterium]|nr:hypothetical protein [Myxococcales bacterium]
MTRRPLVMPSRSPPRSPTSWLSCRPARVGLALTLALALVGCKRRRGDERPTRGDAQRRRAGRVVAAATGGLRGRGGLRGAGAEALGAGGSPRRASC